MTETDPTNRGRTDKVARSLGWFSLGLGAAQLAAPERVAAAVGVDDTRRSRPLLRAIGTREVATGVGILARPRPRGWIWARVAGDALDLGLLAKTALAADAQRRRQAAATIAAVAAVTAADVLEALRLGRAAAGRNKIDVRRSITVNRTPDEVYEFWRDLEKLPRFMVHLESVRVTGERRSHWVAKGPARRTVEWDAETVEDSPGKLIAWRSLPGAEVPNEGSVRFVPAPGDRGTEVRVQLSYAAPGGRQAARAAKLFGEEPGVQLHDDLRRFKQVIETGDVVVSDAAPRGEAFAQHVKERPAQPLPTT